MKGFLITAIVCCIALVSPTVQGRTSAGRTAKRNQTTSAEQLAAAGKWAGAEEGFATLEKQRKLSSAQVNAAVEVSSHLNHWTRVIELLTNFRRHHPLTISQREKLGRAYLMSGQPKEAEAELVSLLRDLPDEEQLVHSLAYLYLSESRFAEAADLYFRYLETHPRAFESHVNLGLIHFKLRRTEEALADLRKAFGLDFEKANVYFYRQLVRNMRPEGLAELAEDTKRALGLPGDGVAAHLHLAREYQNLTRHDNAIEEYEKYLAAKPEDGEARLALATLYFRRGDMEKSEAAVSSLLDMTGDLGHAARLFAAELAVVARHIDRALQLLQDLPAAYRRLPQYKYLAARVALNQADVQTAEKLLLEVIAAEPQKAEAYFHLGQLYLRNGKGEKGRQFLAEFERLRPK